MTKKINVSSLAKLLGIIMGIVGLILGVFYSFGGLIIDTLVSLSLIESDETPGLSYGTVLAFGALIGMPAIFGLFGVITGFVVGILYNLISGWRFVPDIKSIRL